jgi:hypothetical protein
MLWAIAAWLATLVTVGIAHRYGGEEAFIAAFVFVVLLINLRPRP